VTETHSIHPNPGGLTHASSPYKRKLEEIRRQVQAVTAVATADDLLQLIEIRESLDSLIARA
jgi:hypothetical protein